MPIKGKHVVQIHTHLHINVYTMQEKTFYKDNRWTTERLPKGEHVVPSRSKPRRIETTRLTKTQTEETRVVPDAGL